MSAGADLFGGAAIAAGYAADRPPVHGQVLALAAERGWLGGAARRALDLGCGAGASTSALLAALGDAPPVIAIDPAPAMVAAVGRVAPGAVGVVGAGEALPIADGSVDLITAAGSLDFADLDRCLGEAARVLRPGGRLLVYDFGLGARLASDRAPDLSPMITAFHDRWPRLMSTRTPVTEARLRGGAPAAGLAVEAHEPFEVVVPRTRAQYLAYLMTESNVTAAVAGGADPAAIRSWLDDALPWPDAPEGEATGVVFAGYLALLVRSSVG